MTQIKTTFAALGIAALLVPSLAAADAGKKLGRADFDRCNQQAMQVAGVDPDSPAASPQLGTGAGAGQQPSSQITTPSGSPPSTSAGSQTGTQSGTGMQTGGGTQIGTGTQTGTGMSGTGSAAGTGADADLERVVQAYRDCLQQQRN